jgi:arsenite methyltransferase
MLPSRNREKQVARGGRSAISDIVVTSPLPDKIRNDLGLLSACIGGTATIEDTEELLKKAGFKIIEIVPNDKSREIIREWSPEKSKKSMKTPVLDLRYSED